MTKSKSLKSQLVWQCRRGMLELDVILSPFFEKYFDSLDNQQQEAFALLLKEDDPDLYAWLMGFAQCEKTQIVAMIGLIKEKIPEF